MLLMVRIGRVLSLLVCFSPLIWMAGGAIVGSTLDSDSSGFGFAVVLYGIPSIVAATVYYFLVHKYIARAYDELREQPQKPLGTRTIFSLAIMLVLFLSIYAALAYRLLEDIVVNAQLKQYHEQYCEKFPESGDCPEVLAR